METLRVLYCWYWHEGWVVVMSCLCLGLLLFMSVDHFQMRKLVHRLDLIYRGLDQRIVDSHNHLETKIVQVERRTTQTFKDDAFTGNDDKTKVRKGRKGD
jgi:hypothetical protein